MVQSEQETFILPRPATPHSVDSTPTGSVVDHNDSNGSDHVSDAVFVASGESDSSVDDIQSIGSTSEVDWSRVRTRAESVISDGETEDDDESGTYRSGEEESFDIVTPSNSISLQSVPSRTTATIESVLSLEDAQSSIDA
jgi:hypothetical protein